MFLCFRTNINYVLGLRSKVDKIPMLKPTTFLTNCIEVVQAFEGVQCDGSHEHVQCQGYEGGVKRSIWAQQYPPGLVEKLATAVHAALAK